MYIKNIKLTNYRNYESLDLSLGKKVTVLIGKNGMGKTNLISALKQSLSFIFSHNSGISQYQFVADSGQKIKSFETTDARFNYDGNGPLNYHYPIRIETSLEVDEAEPIVSVLERQSLSIGMKETYVPASKKYWNHYDNLQDLPVLAFYSDSYPHITTSLGAKIQSKLNAEFGISQNVAYYNWDDPRDCSNVWQQYFVMQWKNNMYHPTPETARYLQAIKESMIHFSEPLDQASENADLILNDLRVVARGKNDIMVFSFQNGQVMAMDALPAGYRRIFSIAFDIANRSYILNKNCNPDGVVFVDEIDLHLHPSLSQEVLERLTRSFPRLQIIATTHSPLILSNFRQDEDNVVFQLSRTEKGETIYTPLPSSYGVDYNSLLMGPMETPVRNSYLRELLEAYRYWERNKAEGKKTQVAKMIVDCVGENSLIAKELRRS
jgi:hypothetical protein